MKCPISLDNLISALSLALDLAENRKLKHARRTAYIAIRIAEILELSKEEISDIYYGALLHDIGKASLGYSINNNVEQHSRAGAKIVSLIPYLDSIKPLIEQHHERWDGRGFPNTLQGNEIVLGARIIHIADEIESYFCDDYSKINSSDLIFFLNNNQGKAFDPILASACKSIVEQKDFFQDLSYPFIDNAIKNNMPFYSKEICYNDLETIGGIFASLIDNKSPYTASHSTGVAEIAEKIAYKIGLSPRVCQKIKISGLLHDLGKMAIPNEILDKPGKLTNEEYKIIQSHSYYTETILNEIPALEDIKVWSSQHHEKLDGTGYHSSIPGEVIPLESRIIAIADIYHALTDHRPYRQGMDQEKAFKIIQNDCAEGKLDYDLYQTLKNMTL